MKKYSFKLIIMSVAVICIVIAGIMVPGIVLEAIWRTWAMQQRARPEYTTY